MGNSNSFWIARDKNGPLFLYKNKPYKDGDVWVYEGSRGHWRIGEEFMDFQPGIKWEDKEPMKLYTSKAQAIKDLTKNIDNLTQEEQEAILGLLDALKKEI